MEGKCHTKVAKDKQKFKNEKFKEISNDDGAIIS